MSHDLNPEEEIYFITHKKFAMLLRFHVRLYMSYDIVCNCNHPDADQSKLKLFLCLEVKLYETCKQDILPGASLETRQTVSLSNR